MPTHNYRTPVKTLAPAAIPAPGKPPAPRTRHGRGPRLSPEILTDEEVRRLMVACGGDKPVPTRNRALIALMYRAGLRVSEALDLYPKDVDLDAGAVRVLNGKGGRSRTVGLDPGAAAVVRQWLAVRAAEGVGEGFPLLCTWNGGRVSESYVRGIVPLGEAPCDEASPSAPVGVTVRSGGDRHAVEQAAGFAQTPP